MPQEPLNTGTSDKQSLLQKFQKAAQSLRPTTKQPLSTSELRALLDASNALLKGTKTAEAQEKIGQEEFGKAVEEYVLPDKPPTLSSQDIGEFIKYSKAMDLYEAKLKVMHAQELQKEQELEAKSILFKKFKADIDGLPLSTKDGIKLSDTQKKFITAICNEFKNSDMAQRY